MAITQDIREALDLKHLNLPPEPKVLAIEVEEYVDWTGDDALRVLVTIDEDTDVEKVPGESFLEMKEAIHDSLLSKGVELFPYISVAKPSELQDELDELNEE